MESRARTRPLLRRLGIAAALAALLVPAAAGPAAAKHHKHKRPPAPKISKITPRSLEVGETLTIRGHHFRKGRGRNTVAFKRRGHAAVFVRDELSTHKLLKVELSDRLGKILKVRNGTAAPTKLHLRILSKRFGRHFSHGKRRVPLVWPATPDDASTPAPAPGAANGDCDGDGIRNGVDADDDNDLLSDAVEARLKTDPCKYDSDGDGVSDGYEYQSAVDLNQNLYHAPIAQIVPHPYKVAYPNALYADAGVDYDGDSLTQGEEFALWKVYRTPAAGLNNLVYSDGNQYSAYRRDGSLVVANPQSKYDAFKTWALAHGYWNIDVPVHHVDRAVQLDDFDLNGTVSSTESSWWQFGSAGDARISDDERDEDADGLSNYDESHGRMQPAFWNACYTKEHAYPVPYLGTSMTDPDTDGDGVRDGADDQDHDDIPNLMELSRAAAAPHHSIDGSNCKIAEGVTGSLSAEAVDDHQGMVNPFNPCLPYTDSRTCARHPAFGDLPAPFGMKADEIYYVLN